MHSNMERKKQLKKEKIKFNISGVNKPKKIKFNVGVAIRKREEKEKNKINKVKGNTGRASDKYDDSLIKERIAKDKAKVVYELGKTFGIVSNAIAKVKISVATFYKWYKEDLEFRKEVDEVQDGFDVVVEDKLKQKIIQNDGHSIRFYLSHRVKKYRPSLGLGQDDDLEPIKFIIESYKGDKK